MKSVCRKCLDKNWLIECACGCGGIILKKDKQGDTRKFIYQHHMKLDNYKKQPVGEDSYNWKGGRAKIGKYWFLYINRKYKAEHVYFFEQYHKCCVLPWGEIHHIDPVTKNYCNNMIWNLKGVTKKQHRGIDRNKPRKRKDTSTRFCVICKGKTRKSKNEPYEIWIGNDKEGWICTYCYDFIRRYPLSKLI